MAYNKRFKLVQFERATIDLDNAVTYYNSRQEGLGKRFYLEYKKTLKTIKRNPHYRTFMMIYIVCKSANFPTSFIIL